MSADETGPGASRPKLIRRVELPPGPAAALRDTLYELYLRSGPLTLDEVVRRIQEAEADDPDVLGVPGRDVIHQMISGKALPVKLLDAVTVARLLGRAAGTDPNAADQQIRELFVAARMPPRQLGRPIVDCDPIDLEVHRAIDVPGQDGLPVLPVYVPREHDARLAAVVEDVMRRGRSRLVTLVGESSTGKTRACWEAIQPLAELPGRWRVWHPFDPSRPDAAATALPDADSHTVVWLNEAQHYLLPPDNRLGERVAAGLRTLLSNPARGPVLVLATMWPQYWTTATTAPKPGQPDPYPQARQLLIGTDIAVPDTFNGTHLQVLRTVSAADPRLRHATEHAPQGRITQFLAGVPELLSRYRHPDTPAARAIIDVAIDARRLGYPPAIPHMLLALAAPGYLDDHQWEQAGDDWLERALAFTAKPCRGVPGPLTRIRPRPGERATAEGPHYRLADALEQAGRTERAAVYPPESLWTAFTTIVTDADLLRRLGRQAEDRGRYQHAIWLHTRAADRGNTDAMRSLVEIRERAGDAAGAEALAVRAADRDNAGALVGLAKRRENVGDVDGAEAPFRQAADRGHSGALVALAKRRENVGDVDGAEVLYRQAADRGHSGALVALAERREMVGDTRGAEALYRQAADRGDLFALLALAERQELSGHDPVATAIAMHRADAVWILANRRQHAGDIAGAEALYQHAANLGHTGALRDLARLRESAGDTAGAEALALKAADRGDTGALVALAERREKGGDTDRAETLFRRAADRGDTWGLQGMARLREKAGDTAGAEALAVQAADRGDTGALISLAGLRQDTDLAGAEALAQRSVDRGDILGLVAVAIRRELAGDRVSAASLYRRALDSGYAGALENLVRLRKRAGDNAIADQLRRYGLTGAGEVRTTLDFG